MHKEVRDSAQSFKAELEHTMSNQVDEAETLWGGRAADDAGGTVPSTSQNIDSKTRDFRRKKLVHISAVPGWYKNRHCTKNHVLSGAARVRKVRLSAGSTSSKSFFR